MRLYINPIFNIYGDLCTILDIIIYKFQLKSLLINNNNDYAPIELTETHTQTLIVYGIIPKRQKHTKHREMMHMIYLR